MTLVDPNMPTSASPNFRGVLRLLFGFAKLGANRGEARDALRSAMPSSRDVSTDLYISSLTR
ncbi:MAG: hypothetical protein HKM96_15615 [Boseongicola sp.]|nr:hypothetical protein [Silicimonas sp.]NNF92816.1 hypothetical protein [Boseongicola sp.]